MKKYKFLSFLVIAVIMGCANAYKLEKKSNLNFTESYFKSWSSGVKDGGSGYSIFLFLDKNFDLKNNKTEIKGIYFKEKYASIKAQGENKFQAFVKDGSIVNVIVEKGKKEIVETKEDEKIPFELKENEAVISYLVNDKNKYVKIILNEKKTMDFPM